MRSIHLRHVIAGRWALAVAASIRLACHVHLVHLLGQLFHWLLTVEALSWLHWLRLEIATIWVEGARFKHVNLHFELLSNIKVFILDCLSL